MLHMEQKNLHLDGNIMKCMIWYKVSLLMEIAKCCITWLSGKTACIQTFMSSCPDLPKKAYYLNLNLIQGKKKTASKILSREMNSSFIKWNIKICVIHHSKRGCFELACQFCKGSLTVLQSRIN